jgi:L-threonylcarbamoyladenylate synthase
MIKISLDNFLQRDLEFFELLHDDGVFIYPTDTIYGIGCDATSEIAIAKIRKLKNRPAQPFSIIAPSKTWIQDNFIVPSNITLSSQQIIRGTLPTQYESQTIDPLNLLPGRYTLLLTPKNTFDIGSIGDNGSVGVRIPDHTIADFVSFYGTPIVTTSVNIHGQPELTSYADMESEEMLDFREQVGLFVDDGVLGGAASTIIDLRNHVEK